MNNSNSFNKKRIEIMELLVDQIETFEFPCSVISVLNEEVEKWLHTKDHKCVVAGEGRYLANSDYKALCKLSNVKDAENFLKIYECDYKLDMNRKPIYEVVCKNTSIEPYYEFKGIDAMIHKILAIFLEQNRRALKIREIKRDITFCVDFGYLEDILEIVKSDLSKFYPLAYRYVFSLIPRGGY